jgi:tryptophanyl-tRNA synthetase
MEFARDIAGNFNKTYDYELFKLPTHFVEKKLQTIP